MVTKIKQKKLAGKDGYLTPTYGGREMREPVPKFRLPKDSMSPTSAYRLVHDELMMDGNARLNLATFVTTWMEPEAEALMSETFDKNMIDKDEYPQTAKIEERCINIISNMFHTPESGVGTSAIGSSEAIMLAGMAFKWKWRERMENRGADTSKPNLVMGSNVQVVWKKFCRYWEIEPRYVPMEKGKYVIDAEGVLKLVDENTIGVVAILGTTYTGEFDPIEEVHDALVSLNKKTGWQVPVHIDAASGGFVAPFIHPDLKWDFRLPLVKSINVSGHKYGLIYPGVGWVVWRNASDLPEDLVFHVSYLGGSMPTFTLNFSRPANQVIAQYYNFLRLGFAGYRQIMENMQRIAGYFSRELKKMDCFEIINSGQTIPVITFRLKDATGFTEYDMSAHLRGFGWQVPAYPLPPGAEDISVLRVVVREGFSRDMADELLEDIKRVLANAGSGKLPKRVMFAHLRSSKK